MRMQQTRAAMAVTRRIVALFDGVLLTESERATAVDEVYPLVLAAMEEYERVRRREEARLTPIDAKPTREPP